jgi:hypothetical protein
MKLSRRVGETQIHKFGETGSGGSARLVVGPADQAVLSFDGPNRP